MAAIGLFILRIAIARPVMRRVQGTSLRAVTIAFLVASVLGLIAIPVYLDISTAIDSLHSAFDVSSLVPLFRVTAFGRGYLDMEICFALFCAEPRSRSGSTGPSGSTARSPSCSRRAGRFSPPRPSCSCPASPGTRPRPRPAASR